MESSSSSSSIMMTNSTATNNGGAVKSVNNNSKIERAHQMYRDGRYQEALGFYTEALSSAKTIPQKIALHSNRAACFLKLHDFKEAAEECTWVLELDHNHTGALMLRAQTLVTLKKYNSALFDVNRLIELNPSSEVYLNLQARLKTQLREMVFVQGKSLAPIPEDNAELEEDDEDLIELPDNLEEKEIKAGEEHEYRGKQMTEAAAPIEQKTEVTRITPKSELDTLNKSIHKSSELMSSGWQAIPKPKGHSQLDYSRWDSVQDDSSEENSCEDDDDDEFQPQYRFRVRTVGVHSVK